MVRLYISPCVISTSLSAISIVSFSLFFRKVNSPSFLNGGSATLELSVEFATIGSDEFLEKFKMPVEINPPKIRIITKIMTTIFSWFCIYFT